MDDYEFEAGDSGAALIEKVSAGDLHKGQLVMIKDRPCKIMGYSTAKVGKHGSAKAMITGIDLFTAQKYECTYSTGDTVDAPIVKRLEVQLIDLQDDGFCSLMLENGDIKEDIQLPADEWLKDVASKIKEMFEAGDKEILVTVLFSMGEEKITQVREGKEQ